MANRYKIVLAKGTSSQFIKGDGSLDSTEYLPVYLPFVTKTANYTLTLSDYTVDCNGTFTITLPTAVGITGRIYNIKNTGTGIITVDGNGSELIDGELTQLVHQWENLQIQSTGAGWIAL